MIKLYCVRLGNTYVVICCPCSEKANSSFLHKDRSFDCPVTLSAAHYNSWGEKTVKRGHLWWFYKIMKLPLLCFEYFSNAKKMSDDIFEMFI